MRSIPFSHYMSCDIFFSELFFHVLSFHSSSQARLPHVLWEICIAIVATSANASNPSLCLLLCLMMIPTALIDIFVWAPSFALFARFETYTGGGFMSGRPRVCTPDYVKGTGRLFVSTIFRIISYPHFPTFIQINITRMDSSTPYPFQVSVQSLLTGVFYFFTAVVSWTVFAESRDNYIARENAKAIGDTLADGRSHVTIQLT